MAKIQGIVIELGADASGIEQALKDVNKASTATTKELGQINRALKFDPDNVNLLSQKFDVLQDSIRNTETKLSALREAQAEVNRQFQAGEIDAAAYRAFNREIEQTEGRLRAFRQQAEDIQVRIDAQVDVSGIARMTQALDEVSQKAQEVGNNMKDVGAGMTASISAPIAALGTGAALAAGQFDNAAGQIQAALGVTADEAERLEDAATDVWKAGFGESLEEVSDGLIRVKQNMKEIDGTEIESVTKNALALAKTFKSDVNEVTRAGNNLMVNFGISADEAFDMMAKGAQNGLNFSDEMFDNLAEYSGLFANMGYSVEEYFGILQRGSEAGVYNLDYLNDAMKEFQIRAKDGSEGVATAMGDLSQATQDVWDDYYYGKATVKDVATSVINDLMTMEDQTYAGMLGVELFGTKWEDLESKAMYAMLGTTDGLENAKGAMDALTAAQEQTFGQRWESFTRSAAASLEPLGKTLLDLAEQWLPKIISAVESVANWFSNLSPTVQALSVVFGAVVAAIGPFLVIVGSIISALGSIIPLVTSVVGSIGGFSGVLAALTGPIGIVIAAVTALATAGIALWKNWDEVSAFLKGVWESIQSTASAVFSAIGDVFKTAWEGIKSTTETVWNSIQSFFSTIWDGIKSVFDTVVGVIESSLNKYWNSMGDGVKKTWDGIKQYFDGVWDLIKNVFVGALVVVLQLLTGKWGEAKKSTEQIWKNIQDALKNVWESIKKVFSGALDAVKGFIKTAWDNIKSTTTTVFNAVKSAITSAWESVKNTTSSVLKSVWDTVKNTFSSLVNSVTDKMKEVKSTIEKWWNQALSFLKGIDLSQIGRDMMQGLINGIRNMADDALEAITGVADGIVNKAKSVLKIKSPSRVMMEIGRFIGDGLIVGMEQRGEAVTDEARKIASNIINSFEGLQTVDVASLEKLGANKQIKELAQTYNEILEMDKDTSGERERILRASNEKRVAIEAKYAKVFESMEKLREEEFSKLDATERENPYLQGMVNDRIQSAFGVWISEYTNELNDVTVAEKKSMAALDKTLEGKFEKQKEFVEKARGLNVISLLDEQKLYDEFATMYSNDSAEYAYFANEKLRVQKEISEKIAKVNSDFTTKIKKANDDLIANTDKVESKYKDAYNNIRNNILSATSGFGEFQRKDKIQGQTLVKNLESQIRAINEYNSVINSLGGRVSDTGFMDYLRTLGPESLSELEAINSLSKDELDNYVALYNERFEKASNAATIQLQGMRADTDAEIVKLQEETAKQLDVYQQEWATAINEITNGVVSEFEELPAAMEDTGKSIITGIQSGLSEMTPALISQAQAIADAISSTIKEALDINSPSGITRGFGVNIGQGLVLGMDDMVSKIAQTSQRLSNAASNALGSLASSSAKSQANQVVQQQITNNSIMDMTGLIQVIAELAQRPVQTSVTMDGRVIANAVSSHQYNNATLSALTKGVSLR